MRFLFLLLLNFSPVLARPVALVREQGLAIDVARIDLIEYPGGHLSDVRVWLRFAVRNPTTVYVSFLSEDPGGGMVEKAFLPVVLKGQGAESVTAVLPAHKKYPVYVRVFAEEPGALKTWMDPIAGPRARLPRNHKFLRFIPKGSNAWNQLAKSGYVSGDPSSDMEAYDPDEIFTQGAHPSR